MTRLEKITDRLREADADALALTPGATLHYITGFPFEPSDRLTLLIIPSDGTPVAVLPNFEESNWSGNVSFDAELFLWDDVDGPNDAVKRALDTLSPISTLAVEPLVMRVMEQTILQAHLPGVTIDAATNIVEPVRLAKDEAEIASMRGAARIAEAALTELLTHVKIGVTEADLASKLCGLLLAGGGEGISFGPIVLSGPQSALPHGVPGTRKLESGDLLLIDFGTSYQGYHCDITRTFVIDEPDAQTQEIYEAVQKGNELGRAACAPGVTCGEVHTKTQAHFELDPYSGYMTHRTGHGLGLEVHEPPSVQAGSLHPLQPGNVVTIEPGLYLEGWGGVRIEDDVVITATGAESLTVFPRELQSLGQ